MAPDKHVANIESDDNDIPTLSSDTLALLQEFQKSQAESLELFEKLRLRAETRFDKNDDDNDNNNDDDDEREDPLASMEVFKEDWNLSQFWYTDATAHVLSAYLISSLVHFPSIDSTPVPVHADYESRPDLKIAIISAPTVHQYLTRQILPRLSKPLQQKIHPVVFEHDTRFNVFGPKQFVHYDFNQPTNLRQDLKNSFDAVLVDPPFLSEECQLKTAISVRLLLRKDNNGLNGNAKVAVCTGLKVKDVILKAYKLYGVKCTDFRPEHRNGLQNEFRCFASQEVNDVWHFEQEADD
ncbi:putative N6-adenine methyltransferase-domain-containing protein [Lipomyces japonicus]|uniref:putative N6-adenine methyltransferase-domain-containing protein n=1 Tax=Lipomyces japonicus TaxID=56871 RepID=UPI0034CD8D64